MNGPPVILGWRMRIALENAGVSVQNIADQLEVSRDTIRRWTHDEIRPKRLYIRAWADITGVDLDFLVDDDLRLVRGSEGFHPKAVTAGRKLVTDNKDYVDKPPARRGRGPRRNRRNTHSYLYQLPANPATLCNGATCVA